VGQTQLPTQLGPCLIATSSLDGPISPCTPIIAAFVGVLFATQTPTSFALNANEYSMHAVLTSRGQDGPSSSALQARFLPTNSEQRSVALHRMSATLGWLPSSLHGADRCLGPVAQPPTPEPSVDFGSFLDARCVMCNVRSAPSRSQITPCVIKPALIAGLQLPVTRSTTAFSATRVSPRAASYPPSLPSIN